MQSLMTEMGYSSPVGYPFASFHQDLQAAVGALDEENFKDMDTFCNRIMANSIFDNDGMVLALQGFFLKDVALLLGSIKARSPAKSFSAAKVLANGYSGRLLGQTRDSRSDREELWTQFHEFMIKVQRLTLNSIEDKAYVEPDYSFTRGAFQWLASYLDSHKETLLHPKNLFLKGILSEMTRLYRAHGAQLDETYSIALIEALDRCYDRVLASSCSEADLDKKVREEIMPYVKRVVSVLKDPSSSDEVNGLLWELIKRWRQYSIEFMERRVDVEVLPESEEGKKVQGETSRKSTDDVSRSSERGTKTLSARTRRKSGNTGNST